MTAHGSPFVCCTYFLSVADGRSICHNTLPTDFYRLWELLGTLVASGARFLLQIPRNSGKHNGQQ